ncbi:MAG: hypothetical protein AAF658_20440, partial [Myxococcota bacterium]
ASHLSPSASDLKNGAAGALVVLAGLSLCVALATWNGFSLAGLAILTVPMVVVVMGVAALQLSYVTSVALLHRLGAI